MKVKKEIPDFPLPRFLRLTSARLEDNATNQEKWRTAAKLRGDNQPGDERARAVRIETDALQILDILKDQYESSAPEVKNDFFAAVVRESSRLAESIATQGRFDEAARIEPNEAKAAEYQKVWEAVWRDDLETCPCPTFRVENDKRHLNDTHANDVYSLKTNSEMALVKCNCCGFLNVRPLTYELTEARKTQQWR